MAMSKKDYQAIAKVIYMERDAWGFSDIREQEPALSALDHLTRELADMLQADNPRFNRALFLEACETGEM